MAGIPQEYLDLAEDFGFTAVDESEVVRVEQADAGVSEAVAEAVASSAEGVGRLENKIDMLLDAIAGQSREIEERKAEVEADVRGKLTEVEKLVMPLLVKLLKSADKEYIKWENRGPAIQAQIDKLLAITRPQ
jgi:hypothetical protein